MNTKTMMRAAVLYLATVSSSGGAQEPAQADAVDDVVRAEMQKRQVAGLSLAIVQDGKIVKANGYGVTIKGGDIAVTPSTLFQAGSISKPVSAVGALRLVQEGKLSLDEDVNAKLTTWKVPENEFTKTKKVSLRGILSHAAELTVHGFRGYAADAAVPTLVQVLTCRPIAPSPPRRPVRSTENRSRESGIPIRRWRRPDYGRHLPTWLAS